MSQIDRKKLEETIKFFVENYPRKVDLILALDKIQYCLTDEEEPKCDCCEGEEYCVCDHTQGPGGPDRKPSRLEERYFCGDTNCGNGGNHYHNGKRYFKSNAAQREIDRLREALEEILESQECGECGGPQIARQALNDTSEKKDKWPRSYGEQEDKAHPV